MKKLEKNAKTAFLNYGLVAVFFVVVEIMMATGVMTNSFKGQLIPIISYVIMALALNLVVGISGELSLGHAGFMSVGAFTGVIVASSLQDSIGASPLRLLIAILAGALTAAIAGIVIGIPVLRLGGDYLAIVTLAFGEIIKNVMNCMYVGVDSKGLHMSLMDANSLGMEPTGRMILNGPMGATGIKKISGFIAGIILLLIVLVIIQKG